MENEKSNGKVAFITGGNRGLGSGDRARARQGKASLSFLGRVIRKKVKLQLRNLRDEDITAESLSF